MAPNRITRGGAVPRALLLAALALVTALALASCGGGGEDDGAAAPAIDKSADAEILNSVLARELAAVRAYERTLPLLRGPALAAGRQFRAQEQEHTNAVVKALRGLGEKAEPEQEEIESEELQSEAEALAFLYDVESVSVARDLRAISHLTDSWPRALLGSIAANQAQHLVVLRRLLGAGVAESIPEAFEDGTTPDPLEMIDE